MRTRNPVNHEAYSIGPLHDIGPAARWCLGAGVFPDWPAPPAPADFDKEADVITREGLSAVAARALRGSETHEASESFSMFSRLAAIAQMRSMAVDVSGSTVVDALSKATINATIVKGPAVARFHPQGWPRTYIDVDLMVDPLAFDSATTLIRSLGYEVPDNATPQHEWFYRQCREGTNLHSPHGGNIDLHHHISPWALGSRLTASDLYDRSDEVVWCGRPVHMATASDLLVVSALHVLNDLWKSKAGLNSWRDVVVLMYRLGPSDARDAFARVGLAGLHDVMVNHLATWVPAIGLTPVGSPSLSRSERFQLASLGWSHHHWTTNLRLAWALRVPPRNALAFLAGTAVPSRSYIAKRHGTYRHYWKSGFDEMAATKNGLDFRMTTVDVAQTR